jgi:SAM-dependent methyltransferase
MTEAIGVGLSFTAHNVALPDGTQTLPGAELTAENGICQAALRDLELAFPDRALYGRPVTVADLGCLEGGYAAAFAQAGYDVTGIEARAENMACCRYVASALALPNLTFLQTDVRDTVAAADPGQWDAVFCCGLLYHLDNPVAFLNYLGTATRRLLILNTHYSTRPDAEHEGHRGHWYAEGTSRWASWRNERSFWLTKRDLLAAIRDAGFDLVYEQADYRKDILDEAYAGPDRRSMFVALRT